MKYYHSNIYKNLNWLDTKESDPAVVIRQYYFKNCYVFDADNCGEHDVEFVFDLDGNTVYYKLTHSWYITTMPFWDIRNEHEIKKMDYPTFIFPGNRDWINV